MITFDSKEMLLRELMELPKAEPKRVYHRANCTGCVRGRFTDRYGRRITISGVHAFSYTIEIVSITTVTVEHYPNGKEARARFNNLKKVR